MTDRHTFKTGLLAVDINVEEAVNQNFEVRCHDYYYDGHGYEDDDLHDDNCINQ